jgi:hypothetical protein
MQNELPPTAGMGLGCVKTRRRGAQSISIYQRKIILLAFEFLGFSHSLGQNPNPFSTPAFPLPPATDMPATLAWAVDANNRLMHCSKECARVAKIYSITSSARASSVGGTSRPSALAVLRLITSSNLVGCTIGKSAGLVPFNILST